MSARVVDENLLEVRAADGQNDLMALQQLAITGNRAVNEISTIEETLKARG